MENLVSPGRGRDSGFWAIASRKSNDFAQVPACSATRRTVGYHMEEIRDVALLAFYYSMFVLTRLGDSAFLVWSISRFRSGKDS
jgi:hypothetical protein